MRKLILLYILLLLLLSPACQETSGDQPGKIDPETQALMKSEADSLLRLSEFHFQNGYASHGLNGLKRVFMKNPYDQQAFERVTRILAQKEDWKTLVDFYNYAIEKHGAHPLLYRKLGICHVQQGKYDYAINDFRNSVAMESTNPENYIYLAQAYEKLNMLEEAVSTWNLLLIMLDRLPNVENAQEIKETAKNKKRELERAMKIPLVPGK